MNIIHPAEAARANAEAEKARVLTGWAEIVALKLEREKQQNACVMARVWDKAEETDNGSVG